MFNISHKILLRNKLPITHMIDTNTMVGYLMKIINPKDQLLDIGKKVRNEELVPIALNMFSVTWEPFMQGIYAREMKCIFEKHWDDFIQEEVR
jgi:hypothetical protein